MLMPTLSVTAIGVVVGLAVTVLRGRPPSVLLWSVLGAWGGFLLGALVGGVLDVVARSGTGIVVAGHATAVAGAVAATARRRAAPA